MNDTHNTLNTNLILLRIHIRYLEFRENLEMCETRCMLIIILAKLHLLAFRFFVSISLSTFSGLFKMGTQ